MNSPFENKGLDLDYNFHNKITIFKNLVVYKKFLSNVEDIFKTITDSELYNKQEYVIKPWGEWAGNWIGKATQIDVSAMSLEEPTNEIAENENRFLRETFNHYFAALKDYLKNSTEEMEWPHWVKNFDFADDSVWMPSGMTLLKYDEPDYTSDFDYSKPAMNYHTDANNFDEESNDTKQVFTVTFYVNDNYEGGEISFYDSINNLVYDYKPSAGDVTIFPSGLPFYHGVNPFSGGPRYLIRMFLLYMHPGTPEWHANKEKYGEEAWEKMEKERLEAHYYSGGNLLEISYDGKTSTHFKKAFPKQKPIKVE
jgi:hypothetical protein